MKKFMTITTAAAVLSACASHSNEVVPMYVSPIQYQSYTCDQLGAEMAATSSRASQLAGQIDKKADGDAMQMGVGMVLLWPVLFALDGDGPEHQEYSRLQGEFQAMEKEGVKKNCGLSVQPIKPAEQKKAETKEEPYGVQAPGARH